MRCLELLPLSLHRRPAISVQPLNFVPKKLGQLAAHCATFQFVDDQITELILFGKAQIVVWRHISQSTQRGHSPAKLRVYWLSAPR